MTRSQLITALVLIMVICLGLSALLLPEPTDRTPEAVPLVPFPPSEVASVEFRPAPGEIQRLSRLAPDRWELRLANGTRWPASTDRVRAFLRILDRSRGIPANESLPETASSLAIASNTGQTTTLDLPVRFLGGRAVVVVQTTPPLPLITTDELPRLLAGDGLSAWLDSRAFTGIEGRIDSIEVVSAAETMSLSRQSGGAGWQIEAPFAARAEDSLITEMIEGLRSLPIVALQSSSQEVEPPSTSAADATTISLSATMRRPLPDGSIVAETSTHTLLTTGPVGENGRVPVLLTAAASGDDVRLGPLPATVDAARLREIVRRPEFYIARRAIRAEPADIQSLTVELPGGFLLDIVRAGSGWRGPTGSVAEDDAVAIKELVLLLTRTPATVTVWGERPASERQHLARITARGLGGLALATVDLAVAQLPGEGASSLHDSLTAPTDSPTDSRAFALLTAGEISRYYTPESAVEAVRWIAGLSSAP